MRRLIASLSSSLLVLSASVAAAQVGYPPAGSPYLDLEQSQEFSIIFGTYHGHRDAADVAPQGGLLLGAHYEWRPTGPLYLIGEMTRISSESHVINPFKNGAARDLGNANRPLYTADFDLGLGLTGGKTWHRLAPELSAGVGVISDIKTKPDTGGFKFATRLTLNMGAGMRYIVSDRWGVRVDFKDHLYSLGYPESFFLAPTNGTSVIPATQAKSFWSNNPALVFGISRLF